MRFTIAAAAAVAAALSAPSATAGAYGDDLSRCLVSASTSDDKLDLTKWVFAAISNNPALKDMTTMTADQRVALNQRVAAVMDRLVLVDCRKEAVAALKFEGPNVFDQSFGVLGQAVMRELMSNPETQAEVGKFSGYLDLKKWAELGAEAGVTDVQAAPSK